jgi:hypothetical protein
MQSNKSKLIYIYIRILLLVQKFKLIGLSKLKVY